MSKTHSKTAKALSVFLCALMVLSTVCFFNPFPAIKANAAVDVTPTVTPSPSYDMTVNIPESIYLKPGSANFQYFLTNTKSGNTAVANSAAATSMNVYVSCPYASNVSLSYEFDYSKTKTVTSEDGKQSAKAASGLALKVGGANLATKTASGTSISFRLGTSDSLVGWTADMDGTEYFIKWTLTYNVGGKTYTAYYYTTVYVPYLGQSGMSAHSRHIGTYANPENWTYSFITGGHSVTGGSASSKFMSNGSVKKDATDASNAVFVAPLVEFSGNNSGKSRSDVDYPFNNGGTIPWGSNFYIDAFNAQANGGVAIKSNSTSDDDYYACNDNDLASMKITVDTSRFPNYNQIPNLSAGWAQFRHDWDGGDNYLYWISGLNGTTTSGMSEGGLSGATITTNADTSRYEGNSSLAKGLYALNGAVTGGDHLMVFCYRNSYKPYVGNQSRVRTYAGVKLNVTSTNKEALRTALFNVYIHGYAKEMAGSYGTALSTAVVNASAVLADQFATAAEITAATNAVNAALSADAVTAFTEAIQGNRDTADIFVAVPETIYLKPEASNMKSFQCFANNILNDDGTVTAENGTSATGKFTFKCDDITNLRVLVDSSVVKTLNATVTSGSETQTGNLAALKNDGDLSEGGIYFDKVENGTVTGTLDIKDGELAAALDEGQTRTITWRFIYTLSDGNVKECVMAYTVAYAPLTTLNSTAAGTAEASNSGNYTVAVTAWVTGIHSIIASTTGQTDGNGGAADPPLTDSTVSLLGNGSGKHGSDMPLKSGGSGANYFYRKDDSATCNGGVASLYIDTSRFSNYNQIPNFTVGSDINSIGTSGSVKGESYSSVYNFGTEKDTTYADSMTGTDIKKLGEGAFNAGERYTAVPSAAVSTGNTVLTVGAHQYYRTSNHSGRSAATWAYCEFNYTNKQTLRNKLTDIMREYIQDDWAFGSQFISARDAYVSAVKTAYEVLGNPAATDTQISNAASALEPAKSAYTAALNNRPANAKSGTASAIHYAFVKSVAENGVASETRDKVGYVYTDKAASKPFAKEEKGYFGSDDVVVQSNSFTDYEYLGYLLSEKETGVGASVPSVASLNTKTFERYSRIDETIANESRDKLTFYYNAPDAKLSIELNGGVYPVEKLNTEINATAGSTFAVKNPTKAGYTFVGWQLEGAGNLTDGTYTFGLGDGKLVAQWTPVPTESSELIVDPNGGTMADNELLFIEHGAESSEGGNDAALSYNIVKNGSKFDISGKYTQPAFGRNNEQTILTSLRVYLEAGKSYTFKYTDDNELTEFYLFKDGDSSVRANFCAYAAGEHSYTFTVGEKNGTSGDTTWTADASSTGWYHIRLDQNKAAAGEDETPVTGAYSVKNMSIASNGDAKLGYKQAAETEVFIDTPARDGYKFAGWSGLVNGTLTKIDADETNVNGGYVYTFKGKADTLVAQWVDAVYEIGFDNLFSAVEWAENSSVSASGDTVGYDKDNDIITFKNNKSADDTADTESRRAESGYHVTGLVPGKEYFLSYDFASDMTGGNANDCNTYVFVHFYDANGAQINIKNTDINYGDVVSGDKTYVGKYVINYTDAAGNAQSQVTPSEWAGSDKRLFSGLQMFDVTTKDGYGHSDIIFTVPEGTVSMDISFGAQHAGQTVSVKNVQINEYDRVNPVTDYTRVHKAYGKNTAVFGELASAKRLGYDFKGWFTGKNGTGTQITSATSASPYHTKFTVWSNWTEIEYTVTYDAAGGTLAGGTVNPAKYTVNTDKITVASAPSRKGYTFKGWLVTKTNTSVHSDNNWVEETVAAGKVYTDRMYGDVKLTAVWEENASTVKVTVREQNADGTFTDTVITNGKKLDGDIVDLAQYIGAKTGFKAVSVSNNGTAFALNGGKFTVVGGQNYDIVITREREQYTFTVKYVMSDGSTAPATVSKTLCFGQSSSVATPAVTGYTPDKTVASVDAISADTTVTVTYTVDKHNVTVHYVYEDGTTAAEDKTVTVEYNKTYSVESPKITGYTADKTVVSGTMGTTDVTVTVTYKINSHKLTITYKYAENENPETKAEYTLEFGKTYEYAVPEVEGFTSSPEKVTGTMGDSDVDVTVVYTIKKFTVIFSDWDGKLLKTEVVKWNRNASAPASPVREGYTFKGWNKTFTGIKENTEVTALYDINTYTLSFDSNGGTAVGDVKQAFASSVTAPVTSRTGYTFVKWTGDDGSDFPSIMPAKNIKFTASWTANTYTVAFDANGGTGATAFVNATYDADAVLTENGFARTGYTFAGWNTAKDGTGTAYADKAVVKNLASDNGATVTLYAQWTANDYTVIYRVDGVETARQTYKYGETVKAIASPAKEGYTFKGWDTLPAVMPANDITVDAVFEINTYKLTYVVDGEVKHTETHKFGESVTAIAEPTKTGYTFSGWTGVPATMPAHDVTVTGSFTVNTYKLTFMSDGEVYDEKSYAFGADVAAPAAPTKTGYTFGGWDKEIPATMPAADTVITAKWTVNKYTVTFNTDGGTDIAPITQDYGTEITAPAAPTKTGYTFGGWDKEIPATMPAEDMTVNALWNINSYTLTVKYVFENGTQAAATHTESVVYNDTFNVESPAVTGYTPDIAVVSGTMGAEDKTVTVTYTANAYTATFDPDNGSEAEVKSFKFGEKVVAPENPTKTGYVFAGWTPEVPETMPSENISFKAEWTPASDTRVTVKYFLEGLDGTYELKETVTDTAVTGEVYTAEIKSFEGFTFDESSVNEGTVAADGSLVLTLNYERNVYTLTFLYYDSAKGIECKYGMKIECPSFAKTPDGYTFIGWDNTHETMPAGNLTITALYAANTYYVEFDANGGTGSTEKQTFTYDKAEKLTKNTFTKTDFVFVGWNTASDGSGYAYADEEEVKNLTSASDVTVVLYAQYKADKNGNGIPDDEETPWTVTYTAGEGGTLTGETSEKVLDGMRPVSVPAPKANEGYAFRFWKLPDGTKAVPAASVIKADTEFDAVFGIDANGNGVADEDEGKFTVTYDMNGTKITELVLAGLTPAAVPSKDKANEYKPTDKCFAYWTLNGTKTNPADTAITADTEFVAVYTDDLNGDDIPDSEQTHYTVTYHPGNHGTLDGTTSFTVVENSAYSKAWEPTVTPDEGYMFKGWVNVPEKITKDVTVVAVYGDDKNGNGKEDGTDEDPFFTVTFENWDSEVVKTVSVLNGMSAEDVAPTELEREYDDEYHYIFSGWDGDITNITSDITVRATFDAEKHVYGAWEVTKDSTCYEFGESTRVCRHFGCDASEKRPYEKAPHTPGDKVIENKVAATCETDGSYDEVIYCTVCSEEIERNTIIEKATGHKPETVAGESATCTEPGLTEGKVCSVCGKVLAEREIIPALGHEWGEWKVTKTATCIENGEETRTCSRCGAKETRATGLAAHTPGDKVIENKVAATCETDGSYDEVIYCIVCNEEIERNTIVEKAAGHKPETVAGKSATCTEPGLTEGKVCSVCGKVLAEREIIPALGHEWGEWTVTVKPTYTSSGVAMRKCARCGATEEKELPPYVHGDDFLEIIAPSVIYAGSKVDMKAMRMPEEVLESDVVWTSDDDSVISIVGGKIYAVGAGTVTVTATTADGLLTASKTVTVLEIDMDNARIIKFVNMRKMDYTVAGFYRVYNDGAIYWSRESECPFTVYTYSTFNYPTYIVYIDGKAVEADENGVYTIPAGSKNVIVTMAGAAEETPTKPDEGGSGSDTGSGTKVSFWEMILRFFRKLFSIFKKK